MASDSSASTTHGALDLDAIAARLSRATEGPWAYEHCGDGLYCIGLTHPPVNGRIEDVYNEDRREYEEKPDVVEFVAELARENAGDDARFIAHARTDVAALVAEVRRLRAVVAAVRLEHDARAAWLASLPPGSCVSPPPEALLDAEAATREALRGVA